MRLYLALVHFPVLDRNGQTVTSSVTNLDIHDFARLALTFEVEKAYMVTPITQQRDMVDYVRNMWIEREATEQRHIRGQAFSKLATVPSVDAAQQDVLSRTGEKPFTISTSANPTSHAMSFSEASSVIEEDAKPTLLLFGTGWGIAPEAHEAVDARLEPLRANANYNHLPVRAAMAMILDRLVPEPTTAISGG